MKKMEEECQDQWRCITGHLRDAATDHECIVVKAIKQQTEIEAITAAQKMIKPRLLADAETKGASRTRL